jgi:hypothetical protein
MKVGIMARNRLVDRKKAFEMYALEGKTMTDIAEYFGVSAFAIFKISRKENWKDRVGEAKDLARFRDNAVVAECSNNIKWENLISLSDMKRDVIKSIRDGLSDGTYKPKVTDAIAIMNLEQTILDSAGVGKEKTFTIPNNIENLSVEELREIKARVMQDLKDEAIDAEVVEHEEFDDYEDDDEV